MVSTDKPEACRDGIGNKSLGYEYKIKKLNKMRKYYLVFYTGKELGKVINDVVRFTGITNALNKKEIINRIKSNTMHYDVSLTNIVEITKEDYDSWDDRK